MRGAYCGGFWNACALDVGALNLLLNFFRYGQALCVCAYYVFELSGQIISAGEGGVKDKRKIRWKITGIKMPDVRVRGAP